jgi:hypothetical protein
MALRRPYALLVIAGALSSLGASYRTTNFVVEAATPQLAQQIGHLAEKYRKEKAIEWLGYEMPAWGQPCPLHAKVMMSGAGGATTFQFDRGQILTQKMEIQGELERLLHAVLPHEVTHTVFAYHFRRPVPRWADEGGAVLSEDDTERNRHDMLCRQILNTPGRAFPLRRLFALTEYPADVMALYAQGFSVTSFLVGKSNRQAFLRFVGDGMALGWDQAVMKHYQYRTVEELEQAWLDHLRSTRRPPVQLAQNGTPADAANSRVVVRQTVPPVQPTLTGHPIVRGQSDDDGPARSGRPTYLPPAAATPSIPHSPDRP